MVYVIAEAGSCHDGDLASALMMVKMAADCGANAVKFQWLSSAERLCERRNAHDYLDAYRLIAFPRDWHDKLAAQAQAEKIDYLCTTYLPEDVAILDPYVPRFKVASFEATAKDHLEAHRPFIQGQRKPLIVSTGMGTDALLTDLVAFGYGARARMELLHCVSAYPAPLTALNLGLIRRYNLDGFSDHSNTVVVGSWAVIAGAKIVEVHFKLDTTNRANRDYPHALSHPRLMRYIGLVREAEWALGTSYFKAPHPAEDAMAAYRVTT